MWIVLAGLRACTSNERGAFATCSRIHSGSKNTLFSSTFWPCRGEQVERALAHELHAELGDQPPPAGVERGHRVRREDLVAGHLVAEHLVISLIS